MFAGAGLPYLMDKLLGPIAALIAALVLFLVGALFLVAGHLDWEKRSVRRGLMHTIGTFTLIGAASGALVGSIAGAIAHKSTPNESREKTQTTPETALLSLTCDTVLLPVPFHAEIWSLDTIFLKGLIKLSANPLKPDGFWPEEKASGNLGYRCLVKNYGSKTLFGISMVFNATVMNPVEEKDGTRHGGAVVKRSTPIVIIPHPLGPQDTFTFYVCNYDPEEFINIDLPTSATLDGDGSERKTVALMVSSTVGNRLGLIPVRRSSQ